VLLILRYFAGTTDNTSGTEFIDIEKLNETNLRLFGQTIHIVGEIKASGKNYSGWYYNS
jgi:hypothetical protein